jgi:hypothetical protein
MIDAAIRHYVLQIDGVEDIIAARMFPEIAPQNLAMGVPYIVYSRISTPRERHLLGGAGLAHPRFQFSLYDSLKSRLLELSELIRNTFDTMRGQYIGPAGSLVWVSDVVLEDERDGYEPPQSAQEVGLYRKDLDFIVWHAETVPVPQEQT